MSNDLLKKKVALKALDYVLALPENDEIILGIGTGSTTNFFIEALETIKDRITGAVPSSIESEKRLKKIGIPILPLSAQKCDLYIDGADEFNEHFQLIKGGGGALTREKIIAFGSKKFICIVDESKQVAKLGAFPLPIEVIPMARSMVAKELLLLGGDPVLREGMTTDNGNQILDIYNLDILKPVELEEALNQIPGIVCNGLFARRAADVILIGSGDGVKTLERNLNYF